MTPGDPNQLRNAPNRTAQFIGQIPAGTAVRVVGGPVCDSIGILWAQVDFNGLIGWTAEARGTIYYLEPADYGVIPSPPDQSLFHGGRSTASPLRER